MEKLVLQLEEDKIMVEARKNVLHSCTNALYLDRGAMYEIEKEAKAALVSHFSAEANTQEEEWHNNYFRCLITDLKDGWAPAPLLLDVTASQFIKDVYSTINAEVEQ